MSLDFNKDPHRRLNLLTGEWVQVSPHRTQRPWQGRHEEKISESRPKHDAECYLCPRNRRINGEYNPDYPSTYAFKNDFSALLSESSSDTIKIGGMLEAKGERGICKVICFSPRHDLTLPDMEVPQIKKVVDLWVQEYDELGSKDFINYVQIFENKGEIMGCSNPHPHGQIWAQETIPDEPAKELFQFKEYFAKSGNTLLSDYLDIELELKERIVIENDHFVVVVPFWAFWPFETLVISRRSFAKMTDMIEVEKTGLADILKKLTSKYDNVFDISFPYSAGHHPAPTDGKEYPEWHYHMHFYPPLLRSATIKKFNVGYEMLANSQRDTSPEMSAEILRSLPNIKTV
ncbi:MAG: UDP-glucose--hexose-1-phosphate uridylyltransferase [Balneolaceae bacterium]